MTPDLTCSECRQRLPWYVAGHLSPDERPTVERHLADCASCRRELATWTAVTSALAESDDCIPPDTHAADAWLALRGRLPQRSPVKPSQSREVHLVNYDADPRHSASHLSSVGVPASQPSSRHRPLSALLAAVLLVALSAALFGLFGAQLRHGKGPAIAGATSTPIPAPCAPSALHASLPANASISDISMTSPRGGWAVGRIGDQSLQDATPPKTLILRFENCRWQPYGNSISTATLSSVSMTSPTDGWAVGAYVKDTPISQTNGTTTHFWIGDKLLVLHYTNGHWQPADVPAGDIVIGAKVVMTSPDEGWMLVDNGKAHTDPYTSVYAYTLLHYLNGSWNPVPLAFDKSGTRILSDIASLAPGDCWIVGYGTGNGDNFAVAHYQNGQWQTWTPKQVGADTASLYSLSLAGPDDVWVSGSYFYQDAYGDHDGPFVSHFVDGTWTRQHLPAAADQESAALTVSGITMLSPSEGWAFAPDNLPHANHLQAEALHYANGQWRWVTLPAPITVVYGLIPFSPTQGFAVADTLANSPAEATQEGHLLYYDNGTWSVIPTH